MTAKPTTEKTPTLPKKVKVGPYVFKVKCSKKAWKEVDEAEEEHFGLFVQLNETIYIHTGLPLTSERDTLIHELIHTINYVSGLTTAGTSIDDLDEATARVQSPLWLQMLRDNPQLVRYLTAE